MSSGSHYASIALTDSESKNSAREGGVLDLSDTDYSNVVNTL